MKRFGSFRILALAVAVALLLSFSLEAGAPKRATKRAATAASVKAAPAPAGLAATFIRANITSGGTPQQISSSYNAVKRAVFIAPYANTALVKLGLSGFSTNYITLQPGQQLVVENFDLSLWYVDGTTDEDLELVIFN